MSFLLNLQSYSWYKPVDSPDESELNNGNLQSSFLNWLWKGRCNCYGHHTWAEARRGGILGYGERESQDKVVKTFEEILKGLAGLDDTTVDKLAVTVEERTFKCAAELGMLWVKTYWKFMQKSSRERLSILCRAGAEQRQVNHSPTKKEMNNLPWRHDCHPSRTMRKRYCSFVNLPIEPGHCLTWRHLTRGRVLPPPSQRNWINQTSCNHDTILGA